MAQLAPTRSATAVSAAQPRNAGAGARWVVLRSSSSPAPLRPRLPPCIPGRGRCTPLASAASTTSSAPPGTTTIVLIAPSPPASAAPASTSVPMYKYHQLEVPLTAPGISLIDITPHIRELVTQAGLQEGCVHVLSRHTTTAVTINENEARLMDDVRQFLSRLAPAGDPYLHNDLHLRPAPDNWPGGWAAWAAQEPRNAHSHLLSMLLGNTLTVPVTGGRLALGTWQSVLLVELDGPRPRTVGVQLVGQSAAAAAAQ